MTVGRNFEDPAAAPGRASGPEPSWPGSPRPPADQSPDSPADFPGPLDPDHPQWLRRRKKLNILFGASLATFLGVGLAAIANMVRGLPVDPNAASVMWPLGSAAAAAAGIYVWQGVRRSDVGTGWPSGGRGGWREGLR